jgi:feruloyl esterase
MLDDTKLALLGKAVHAACDGPTLLADGVIDDPRACTFDPAALQCPGADQPDCLTAAQVDTVRKLYGGAKNAAGEQLMPGLPFGSELNWDVWVVGQGATPPLRQVFSEQRLKYIAFQDPPGPRYTLFSFNFDTDVPKLLDHEDPGDATSPDLTAFQAHGGKLLMYQGWADPAITPFTTITYYDNVVRTMGGREQTDQFFRLFMIPGMYHCSGGPGADPRDNMFAAIENWVENGAAPDQLVATHATNGTVDRTRPIYPYPKVARYSGRGSPDDAASFIAVEP